MSETPSPLERAAARNLVRNYLKVKHGENVVVEAWSHTLAMSSALVDEVRQLGASAFFAYEDDDAWWRAVERKQGGPLGSLSRPEWAAIGAADVYVQTWGPGDSARLWELPDALFEPWADGWFDRWYKTARRTGLRGTRMATGWITDTRARHWGVSKARWRTALLEACLVDPKVMADRGKRLARAFRGTQKVRITHPNGTDVEVALAGVSPRIYEGYPRPHNQSYGEYAMMANFPEGRFRVALDAKTAEGTILGNRRSYEETWFPWTIYSGGAFEFSGGKLTSFSFEEGGAQFAKDYAKGSPGKDRTGSLTIGLNPTISNVPYLEDREPDTIQFFVGGNAHLGGPNRSDFRRSVVLAGSEISVDGTPVVRAGKIL